MRHWWGLNDDAPETAKRGKDMQNSSGGTTAPDLLTAKQVAERLQVGRNRVYTMANAGLLPSVRISGTVRFPRAGLERWLDGLLEGQGQQRMNG